ncbi:hypothetical protein SUGI_0365420 [Cryptomeria japonica]|nr:hypothetical protein SUGI_0365420 [Cryptomeria japonica]
MDLTSNSDGYISESEIQEYEGKSYEDLMKGNHVKKFEWDFEMPFCRGRKNRRDTKTCCNMQVEWVQIKGKQKLQGSIEHLRSF